ncbi:MAG TPA: DUF3025 domain-containing protein [Burkholderiaceae bacterium]|nr:DUF3025 domain-containing protein [Burkholderiaceae bacterium]
MTAAAPWLAPFGAAPRAAALPVRFVPQSALPPGEAYEAFIARTGCVPTRDNRHDHFNRRVWERHPAIKLRLNALHAAEIATHGIGPRRGALRDALTLFDEFGALWPDVPPRLAAALAARDWHALFATHRALWADHRFEIFGHALLEQLESAPRKGLTAHVLLADPLALTPAQWAAKPFLPLPVLGIPGWWPGNEDPAFYADTAVFRPARLKASAAP